MIFIKYTLENADRGRVELRHFKPGILPQETLEQGVLVDSLPDGEFVEGKNSTLYINPLTKEMWYEYVDAPKDSASLEIEELKQDNMILQLALAETIEKQETDKINNQIALAELVETLILKGVL